MNGSSIFLDTNIILYLLSGDETVAEFLNNKNIFISFVTELELLGYKDMDPEELPAIENLLADITIVDINTEIKKTVIGLRKSYKLKLPDAIIAATSVYLNLTFMTSDRNLSKLSELNILLYEK
jgi:predicted nucleic acid-binding protein